jgi:hypothetical protein
MNNKKCGSCGLINFSTDETCRRCGVALSDDAPALMEQPNDTGVKTKRTLVERLLWITGMTATILFISYVSMLLTSDRLPFEQKQEVERAIAIIERGGFDKEAFFLRHIVNYRATDNWWNIEIGHHDAYAATNFPFEVVTLYPEFFADSVDDTERAAMLLHESHHLFASGETATLESTWREKGRIGWTAEKYSQTKVWDNTKRLTVNLVPSLFQCGAEGRSDCVP